MDSGDGRRSDRLHPENRGWMVSDYPRGLCYCLCAPPYMISRTRDLQYTPAEDRAVRVSNSEIQIYNPSAWAKGATDKLRVEGLTAVTPSPGQYPALAVFVAEKKVRGC